MLFFLSIPAKKTSREHHGHVIVPEFDRGSFLPGIPAIFNIRLLAQHGHPRHGTIPQRRLKEHSW